MYIASEMQRVRTVLRSSAGSDHQRTVLVRLNVPIEGTQVSLVWENRMGIKMIHEVFIILCVS